ncbi:MAG: ribonuclease protein component [Candidatus Atribacteria bacterium]|nr:ribonuclease protein component [Candidatus Atribacteria bacterium]
METISREQDFAQLFRNGKRVSAGAIRLWYRKRTAGKLRVCFAGKSKKAVYRNRIRRRLREAFRVNFLFAVEDKPWDLFFLSDERLLEEDFTQLVSQMGKLLDRAGIGNNIDGK